MTRFLTLVLALCGLTGASGCRSVADRVRTRASSDFGCPEEQVTTEAVSNRLMRATGCGTEALYTPWVSSPFARAAFDLACPKEQLKMFALGDATLGVEGCGKRASYTWTQGAWVGSVVPTP